MIRVRRCLELRGRSGMHSMIGHQLRHRVFANRLATRDQFPLHPRRAVTLHVFVGVNRFHFGKQFLMTLRPLAFGAFLPPIESVPRNIQHFAHHRNRPFFAMLLDEAEPPFLSFAKGWGKFNTIGSITGRIPMDRNDANYSLVGSLHFDYELFENFFPLVEFNFIQYLSDGDKYPLRVAGGDYANIGANDVAGKTSFFGGVGFRYKFAPNIELGAIYQFPMMRPGVDVLDHRITVSMIVGL